MGHIAYVRNQYKSIGTYDNVITLIKKGKKPYLLFENSIVLHLNKLEFPLPKDAICQVWLKLAEWFWRRRFLIFMNASSLFRSYLP